jgi:hypothetical protein
MACVLRNLNEWTGALKDIETSASVRERVLRARKIQTERNRE